MEDELKRILALLGGASNEEKVAGLMLSVKLLEMDQLSPEVSKVFLRKAYSLLNPDFIIRLMWNNEKRRIFRPACMSMIASSIQMGLTYVFRDFSTRLIDLLFSSVYSSGKTHIGEVGAKLASESDEEYDKQFVLDLLLTIKLIAADRDSKAIDTILKHLLFQAGEATTELPVYFYPYLLDLIADLSELRASSELIDDLVMITEGSEENLRMIIVKGFHGGAPEVIRDSSLHCCLRLLSSNSAFSPRWSVERMQKVIEKDVSETNLDSGAAVEDVPGRTDSATDSTTDTKESKCPAESDGKFAMLLVSVVGIEVHLLLEEALSLFKQPQGEPQEPSYGDIRDPSVARRKAYDEAKVNNSEEYSSLRISRVMIMIPRCMSLVNAVLMLLVGGDDDEGVAYVGHWSFLSSTAILQIRQTVHNIFQKVFDFLKEISDISEVTLSNICRSKGVGGTVMDSGDKNDALLVMIVQQVTAALTLWVLEDEDIRGPFVHNLPLMLRWSLLPLHFSNDITDNNTIGVEKRTASSVWRSLSTISKISEGGECADIGDVLHYILPCLAEVSCTLAGEDELADKICCLEGGSLFCRLVNIAVLVGQNASSLMAEDRLLNNEGNKQLTSQDDDAAKGNGFDRLCYTCCSACDLLTSMLTWRQNDIVLLRRGESEGEALCALFSLTKDTFPHIPPVAAFSLSKSKRSQEDRHSERLADLLAVASRHFNFGNDGSAVETSHSIVSVDRAICDLVTELSAISIE